MRLYHHPMSSNARRALMTAIHLGLPLELAEVDLMNADDRRRLADIEAYTQQHFRPLTIDGLEPTKFFPPIQEQRPPARKGGGGRPGARSGAPRRGFGESRGPKQIGGGFKEKSPFDARPSGAGSYKKESSFKPAGRPAARAGAPRAKPYAPGKAGR